MNESNLKMDCLCIISKWPKALGDFLGKNHKVLCS